MAKAYYITHWDKVNETADSRKCKVLAWFAKVNKLDGLGFSKLKLHSERVELYCAWALLECMASRGVKGQRGWLMRDGKPLTADDLALLTGFPTAIFDLAFDYFSSEESGWLALREIPAGSPGAAGDAGRISEVPGDAGRISEVPGDAGRISATDRQTDRQTDIGRSDHLPEIPDDRTVREFAAAWLGEPSSGTPVIPDDFLNNWLKRMTGRSIGWPRDWRRALVADWREGHRTWGKSKKNAAAKKDGPRERWQIEKDLDSVRASLQTHELITWPSNKPKPPELQASFDALVQQRKALEKELK